MQTNPAQGGGAYKNWVVLMLWGICVFNYADRQAISSVLPVLKRDYHFTPFQLGLIGSSFMWVYAAAAPIAGFLADRLPRKALILGGCLAWSLLTGLTGWCVALWQFVGLRAAVGFGETFYFPASMSMLSDYHGPQTRSRAMAWHQSGVYVGTILGGWLAAVFAESLGWRFGFYFFGGLGMVLALVLYRFLREPTRGASDAEPATGQAVGNWSALAVLMAVFFGVNFVAGYFLVWTPLFLVDKFHFHLAAAGLSGAAFIQIASLVGVPIAGALADRAASRMHFGRVVVQAVGLAAGSVFVVLVGQAGALATLFVGLIGFGFFKAFYDAGIFASLYDVVGVQARGQIAGWMNTCGWAGGALGAIAMGAFAEHGGHGSQMANMSFAISLGGGIYLLSALALAWLLLRARPRGPS